MSEQSVQELLSLAYEYHRAGQPADAEEIYKQIIAEDPAQPDALYLLGILLFQSGRKQEAAGYLQRAADSHPDSGDLLTSLASVRVDLGDYAAAIPVLDSAAAAAPANPKPLSLLGEVFLKMQRFEDAVAVFQQLNALMPAAAGGWYNLGRAYEGLGRLEDAVAAFDEAVKRKPDFADAYSATAAAMLSLDRPVDALEASRECIERAPDDVRGLASMVVAFEALGEDAVAESLVNFERFVRIGRIEPPPDYVDLDAFNAALVEHILSHPTLRLDAPAAHCHDVKITGDLLADTEGPIAVFREMMGEAFHGYRRRLPKRSEHPFAKTVPERWEMPMWATVMDDGGYQSAHIHPAGWLSGVYYAAVPESVTADDPDHRGWLELGMPPDNYPAPKTPLVRRFMPEPGKLVLFPSYIYHRTIPFEADARRVSIAFNIEPVRESE